MSKNNNFFPTQNKGMASESFIRKIAPFCICLSAITWGFMALLVKFMKLHGASSMQVVFSRGLLAPVTLGIVLLWKDRSLFRIHLRDLWCFIGTGVIGMIAFSLLYFRTMDLTAMSVASILLYTSPAFVMVISAVLFHERITLRKISAFLCTLFGCFCVSGVVSGNMLNPIGLVCGLLSGLAYALYSIFTKCALNKNYSHLTISFYTFIMTGIVSLIPANPPELVSICINDPMLLFLMIMFGPVLSVASYLLYTFMLNYTESSTASIIASIEPVATAIFGIIFLHESITIPIIVGMIAVIAAVLLCSKE